MSVLIPFLAGLLFGRGDDALKMPLYVLIPFLAGLLFGLRQPSVPHPESRS